MKPALDFSTGLVCGAFLGACLAIIFFYVLLTIQASGARPSHQPMPTQHPMIQHL